MYKFENLRIKRLLGPGGVKPCQVEKEESLDPPLSQILREGLRDDNEWIPDNIHVYKYIALPSSCFQKFEVDRLEKAATIHFKSPADANKIKINLEG